MQPLPRQRDVVGVCSMESTLRSTFNPILGAYHPELRQDGKASRPPSQWKVAPGIVLPLEGVSKSTVSGKCATDRESGRSHDDRGPKSQRKKGSVPERDVSAADQKSSFFARRIVNERDLELKRKRIKVRRTLPQFEPFERSVFCREPRLP